MAEDTWTSIEIGGAIPQNLIPELIDLVEQEFGDLEVSPEDAIHDALRDKTSVNFTGNVNYGNPDEVCGFCQEHGLPYWLWCDDGYEWASMIKIWRPGFEEELSIGCNSQTREPLIPIDAVMKFESLAKLKAWAETFTQKATPALTEGPPKLSEDELALGHAEGA
jgi:hypothetical protein